MLCVLFSMTGFSQNHRFENIHIDEGLPASTTSTIVQADDGYLWLLCEGNLLRFDGQTFDADFVPPDFHVRDLQIYQGEPWFRGGGGIYRIHHNQLDTIQLIDGRISDLIIEPSGKIWCTVNRKVWKGDSNGLDPLAGLPDESWQDLYAYEGRVLLVTSKKIYEYEKGSARLWYEMQERNEYVWSCFLHQGELWFASNLGLHKLSAEEHIFERLSGNDRIQQIFFCDDNLWLASKKGLIKYKPSTANLYLDEPLFLAEEVGDLLRDREHVLWIATRTAGLFKFRPNGFDWMDKRDGLPSNAVYGMDIDTLGNLWLGTGQGVFTTAQTENAEAVRNGQFTIDVWDLECDSRGDIWLGCHAGLFRFNQGKQTRITAGRSNFTVWNITEDHEGMVWISTNVGALKYDYRTDAFNWHVYEAGEISSLRKILVDEAGNLWLCGQDSLIVMSDTTVIQTTYQYGGIGYATQNKDGVVWLSTWRQGVVGVRLVDGRLEEVARIDETSGLPSDISYYVLLANDSTLYVGTVHGLAEVHLQNEQPKVVDVYTDRDGFIRTESNINGVLKLPDESLLFGTMGGAVHFDPKKRHLNTSVPGIRISELWIENELRFVEKDLPETFVLAPRERDFQIKFKGLSPGAPEKVSYEYRLLGFEEAWVSSGTINQATYTNLPHGSYTFEVRAINGNGIYSKASKKLAIEIEAWIYETLWFQIGAVLVLAILIVILVRRYIASARKKRACKNSFCRTETQCPAISTKPAFHFQLSELNSRHCK